MPRSRMINLLAAIAAVATAAAAGAQTWTIPWNSIDCGGAMFATGGTFQLGSTIGQADAGTMSGGSWTLEGGFWAAATSTPATCPGDVNGDRQVNLTDLAILLAHFGTPSGQTRATGDLDADGDVDLSDLSQLLAHFGGVCP